MYPYNDDTQRASSAYRSTRIACVLGRTYHEGVEEKRRVTPVVEKRSVPGSGNGGGGGGGRTM